MIHEFHSRQLSLQALFMFFDKTELFVYLTVDKSRRIETEAVLKLFFRTTIRIKNL